MSEEPVVEKKEISKLESTRMMFHLIETAIWAMALVGSVALMRGLI